MAEVWIMAIENNRIVLRHPVLHRDLGTRHYVKLVYGDMTASDMWYFINDDGTFNLTDWTTIFTSAGVLFANVQHNSPGCQLYVTVPSGNPSRPISCLQFQPMGIVIDPRTGKDWDPNLAFYSNMAN